MWYLKPVIHIIAMEKYTKAIFALAVALTLTGAGCSFTTDASNQDSPEAVVTAFVTALQEKDQEEAEQYLDGSGKLYLNWDEAWPQIAELDIHSFEILETEGNEVTVEFELTSEGEAMTDTEKLEVIQRGDVWWIMDL